MGFLEYIRSFPDVTGDGVPDIPERYRGKSGRQIIAASWNPVSLLKRGTYVTWIAVGLSLIVFLVIALLAVLIRHMIRRS